jgi:hypothetical protein
MSESAGQECVIPSYSLDNGTKEDVTVWNFTTSQIIYQKLTKNW